MELLKQNYWDRRVCGIQNIHSEHEGFLRGYPAYSSVYGSGFHPESEWH